MKKQRTTHPPQAVPLPWQGKAFGKIVPNKRDAKDVVPYKIWFLIQIMLVGRWLAAAIFKFLNEIKRVFGTDEVSENSSLEK